MLGHTDKNTINKRRSMTDNMRRVLGGLSSGQLSRHRDMTQSEANACKALCDRGYAEFVIDGYRYTITEAGRKALTADEHSSEGLAK